MIDFDLMARLEHRLARWLKRPRVDLALLAALLAVAAAGLVVLFSASAEDPGQVVNQALRLTLGFSVLFVFARIPPTAFRTWTPWFYAFTVMLLIAVLIFGEGRGAHRWLDFKLIRFQPSEFAKLALPMMVAWYLHDRALPPTWRNLAVCAVLIGLPAGLIMDQPDLGTALLVLASGAFVVFLAGLSWGRIALIIGAALAALPVLWHGMHEYQRNRVRMFLDPEADPLGNGWNIIQSGPPTMPSGAAPGSMPSENWVTTPVGEIRATRSLSYSVNQRLPSGPAVWSARAGSVRRRPASTFCPSTPPTSSSRCSPKSSA